MKNTVFPHTVAFLILGLIAPLAAQNLETSQTTDGGLQADGTHGVAARFDGASDPGAFFLPPPMKVQGWVDEQRVIAAQDSRTLGSELPTRRQVESVVDLGVLRQASPYRSVAANRVVRYQVSTDSLQEGLAALSATYRESGAATDSSNCEEVALSVEQKVKLDVGKVLEIVETEVTANSGCACEIVKTAIKAAEADPDLVVAIVETAIHASPESMRIVSQCAIAANPDSIAAVQALLARLDPQAGQEDGYSSKSAKSAKDSKDAKVASIVAPPLPNPLDLPPSGPPITPPPIIPPVVTDVDP